MGGMVGGGKPRVFQSFGNGALLNSRVKRLLREIWVRMHPSHPQAFKVLASLGTHVQGEHPVRSNDAHARVWPSVGEDDRIVNCPAHHAVLNPSLSNHHGCKQRAPSNQSDQEQYGANAEAEQNRAESSEAPHGKPTNHGVDD